MRLKVRVEDPLPQAHVQRKARRTIFHHIQDHEHGIEGWFAMAREMPEGQDWWIGDEGVHRWRRVGR
jgi:hypothetical protein